MTLFGWLRKSARPPAALAPDRAPVESAPAVPDPATGSAAPSPSPDSIRRQVFDAVAAGDEQRLEALCREHQNLILAGGAAWLEVPESFRSSSEAYDWYQQGLRAIAEFCSEKLDREASTPPQSDAPTPSSVRHN